MTRAELETEVTLTRRQADALHQISTLTSAELGVQRVMERITQASQMIVQAQRVRMYIVDELAHQLILCYCSTWRREEGMISISHQIPGCVRIPIGEGLIGTVASTGQMEIVGELQYECCWWC